MKKKIYNFELLNDILQETKKLIKIFVMSIKRAVRQAHGPERSRRAEKKNKLNCGAERHHYSMFDVGCSVCSMIIFQNNQSIIVLMNWKTKLPIYLN